MEKLKDPKVTVLMPVYNCESYINEAIDSILSQTFNDFEFLIIDDASTDKTISIIKTYQDTRIKLIEKPFNTGLTNSLNLGIKLAKGKYIARMDGDDISMPERFEKQISFLDINQEIVLCGTNFTILGSNDKISVPEENEKIKIAMLKMNCFAHPSVMIRKEILEEFQILYDETKEPAEDYDLWARLISKGKLYNLQETLLQYRVHNSQVSHKRVMQQRDTAIEIRIHMLEYLNYSFNENEYLTMRKIFKDTLLCGFKDIESFLNLKKKLILVNSSDHFFDKKGFDGYLFDIETELVENYFNYSKKFSPVLYFRYFKIKSKLERKLNTIEEFKLLIKSIIFYKLK